MKKWIVTISGRCTVCVQADNAKEAMKKAEIGEDTDSYEIIEWSLEEAEEAEEAEPNDE